MSDKRHDFGKLFGKEFQCSVLKFMMEDNLFLKKAIENLKPDYFMHELKWFYSQILSHYRMTKLSPSKADLAQDILRQSIEDQQTYHDTMKAILNAQVTFQKVKVELTGFIRANMFIETYEQAAQLYNSSNRDNAYNFTKDKLDALLKVDFNKDRTIRFGNYENTLAIAAAQKEGAIPTGIRLIDEAMGGGMFPQTWTTFVGASNAGKSMLTCSLTHNAVMAGKKVFITFHEDEENPYEIRMLSCFSGVPFTKLLSGINFLTPEEQTAVAEADQILSKNVRMRGMYSTEATLECVLAVVRQEHENEKMDLFICDYGQCLTSKMFESMDNPRLLHEYIYYELKQLCLDLNIAGCGGAQANREGNKVSRAGTDFLRMTDIAEAFGIARKSSNLITINRSNEDSLNNLVTFLLDKVRNGRCPVAVQCKSDYSRCRTHMDGPGKQLEIRIEDGPGGNQDKEYNAKTHT